MIKVEKKPFKDYQGRWIMSGLFFEKAVNKEFVVYTLKEEDHLNYPSLRRLYLEMEDLTEYEFAKEYLGGWEHWKRLINTAWFKPIVDDWREELDVKLKARALYAIQATAKSSAKEAFQANKYLLEKGWEKQPKGGVGRTSKDKIKKEALRLTQEDKDTEEDASRILN